MFHFHTNPIAVRELRRYERSVPIWTRRAETVGVVIVALAICAYLIVRWLIERPAVPLTNIYHLIGFDVWGYVQVSVGIVYACVLLRFTAAGVDVANRYQQRGRNDILLTGISASKLIFGQWYAAVYQVRGWMVALGLIRIVAFIVMMAEYQFNVYWNHLFDIAFPDSVCCGSRSAFDYGYHSLQIPLALTFGIILGLFEVWATVGVGILAGTWLRQATFAWVTANVLRAIPIVLFCWFPAINSPGTPYDLLVTRWYEYTWFAFVDGGTSAMLRLTIPTFFPYVGRSFILPRGILAFFAAFHMLVLYAVGSCLLARVGWRRLGASSVDKLAGTLRGERKFTRTRFYENALVIGIALAVVLMMVLAWFYGSSTIPDLGHTFYYNPIFLNWLQTVLWVAVGLVTLRAISAGIQYAQWHRATLELKPLSALDLLRQCIAICQQLRGWGFGLGIMFIAAFGLLVAEHLVNVHSAGIFNCALLNRNYFCGDTYFGWQPAQWVFGFAVSIVLSWMLLLSGVTLGIGSGMIVYRPSFALCIAFVLRTIPVVLGSLLPDAQIRDYVNGTLVARWNQDPLMIFGDSGISALLGMAEPFRHTGHVMGLTNIGYGILTFTLVMYMLFGYILVSIAIVLWRRRRLSSHDVRLLTSFRSKLQT